MFKIVDGRTEFYQWDLNRQIQVEDNTITELHFCNKTDDCALVVEVVDGVANVPNILLQASWDVRVYGFTGDYTKVEKRFKVVARSKPADYVYTEEDIKKYDDLVIKINNANAVITLANETSQSALSAANQAGQFGYAATETISREIKPKLAAHEERLDALNTTANNIGNIATNAAMEVRAATKAIDSLEEQVGNIENALNEIATLQESYIGG